VRGHTEALLVTVLGPALLCGASLHALLLVDLLRSPAPWWASVVSPVAAVVGLVGGLAGIAFAVQLIAVPLLAAVAIIGGLAIGLQGLWLPGGSDYPVAGLAVGALAVGTGLFLGKQAVGTWRGSLRDGSWSRGFARRLGTIVMGPPSPATDALSDERRLTAWLRARSGVVSSLDLMVLFGWTAAEADREVVRILVDYGGDVVVTDDGAMLFTFDALLETGGAPAEAPVPYVDDPPPAPRWLGEGTALAGFLAVIGGLSMLALAMHPDLVVLPTPATWARLAQGTTDLSGRELLFMEGPGGWLPVVVLGAALLRLPLWIMRLVWRARLDAWLGVLRVAWEHPNGRLLPCAPAAALLVAAGGDIDLERSGPGGTYVWFPEHARARAASAALRESRGPRAPAPVVWSTDRVSKK
jgi:hypothetical protein